MAEIGSTAIQMPWHALRSSALSQVRSESCTLPFNCPICDASRPSERSRQSRMKREAGFGDCQKKTLLRTVSRPPGASKKNHNRLRLVSGSEYRMASIRIELCRQVSFCNSPGNERALRRCGWIPACAGMSGRLVDRSGLLKLQHEIVDRHVALEAREVMRVGGIAPEIAGADQLEARGFDFLAQGGFLDTMQCLAD